MAAITAKMVQELRSASGAGIMDCKRALQDADGDMEKALRALREKGLAEAAKRAGRTAAEGVVDSYIHMNGRIGVLIEVNCESDFVANTDAFRGFVRDMAMQVAAARPEYVSRDEVPQDVVERERAIYHQQALNEGKPERIAERIVDGRLQKYYATVCLLEQPFIKDGDQTVEDVLKGIIAALGENIAIRRFARFERGEGIAVERKDLAAEVEEQLRS